MSGTGESCSEKFIMWLAIGLMVFIVFVVPVVVPLVAFMFNRDAGSLLLLILGLAIFSSIIAVYFDFWDRGIYRYIFYGIAGIGVLALVGVVIPQIRDTFAKDTKSGVAELIAIPVALVVYGLVTMLVPVGASEGYRKLLLGVARLLTILIISVLIYLIYR